MRRSLLALALTACLAAAQQKKPVTLEVLNNPATMEGMGRMGGQPIWSPGGGKYVSRQQGKLKLYDVSAKSETELLDLSTLEKDAQALPREKAMGWENRRVAERPIQWAQDGKQLLLSVNGDLFLFDIASKQTTQLTRTAVAESDAKLSPDGTKVSFRREHDLYVMDIATKKVTALTTDGSATLWNGQLDWVYPEELDLGTAHWWSPDSKTVAYMQFDVGRETMYPHGDFLPVEAVAEPQRYPKAGTPNAEVRVGVVSATGGRTRWMDLGDPRAILVARVYWAPDNRWLAIFRTNRVQDKLDILHADVESGQAEPIIQERSPYWVNINDDFHFLKDGNIVLTSERGDWRHIYLHNAKGTPLRQVTRGEWEVTHIACVDEAAKKIYYVSTEVSPLERHLYSVNYDGSGKAQLTKAEGTHSISMSPDCGVYQDSYSSLKMPARRALFKNDGSEWAVLAEPDMKVPNEYEILPSEIHKVKGPGGIEFYARLTKPANFDASKKYPAVVFVYGGPHAQTVANRWSGISWEQVLAHKGFVIWQMDNRGSAARGHAWEGALYRRLGKVELEDQTTGVRYLTGLGFVDEKRVGVTGWSYGGFMTMYSLLHAPEVFAAGVAGAAVNDWRNYDTIYTERYLGLPQDNEQGYKDSSPVTAAANLKGKLLMIHNLEDDNVLFANAVQMADALQKARKPFEMQYYAFKAHGLMGPLRPHYMETATRFFEQALKP